MEKSSLSNSSLDIEDIFFQSQAQRILYHEEKYVTVEYQLFHRNKILKDKSNSSDLNTLTTKLLKTLDQGSTSKEKGLTPFWTSQSTVMSRKLWLPTKIGCVDSVMSLSSESSKKNPMGKSWFSIKKRLPAKKILQTISFPLSQFSLPDSTDLGVTVSNVKSKIKREEKPTELYKTLKFRIFPTKEEQKKLKENIDQQRWYYNAGVNVFCEDKHIQEFEVEKDGEKTGKIKISRNKIRDYMRKFDFKEGENKEKIFTYDEDRKEFPCPEWWTKPPDRVIRGAFDRLGSNMNSSLSNRERGNIDDFNMSFKSRKQDVEFMRFEDKGYPSYINKIKSRYWFRNKSHHRKTIQYSSLLKDHKCCGVEILYDKVTDQYFLHCPVDKDWFPEDDVRNDSQVKYKVQGNRTISLDPGVRKFLVGYDPTGKMVFIGRGACKVLTKMLLHIDTLTDKGLLYLKWKEIKNYVNELHWKTISFLIENYDNIIIPEFRIKGMLKSNKISKMTKRLMAMFSFHTFKERLLFKCKMHNKKFMLVTEEYTSKTCTNCGALNDTYGKEYLQCQHCNIKMDRDVNGSRNILIKNTVLR